MGQGFNFAAMIIPVAFAPHAALVNLVVATSISSALLYPAILALPMTYPSISSDRSAATGLIAALLTLVTVASILIGLGVVALSTFPRAPVLIFSAIILFFQGLDNLLITWLVRQDNSAAIAKNRFRFGIVNVVVTSAATYLLKWQWGLTISAAAVYGIAAVWIISGYVADLKPTLADIRRTRGHEVTSFAASSRKLSLSYIFNGGSIQMAGLSVASLGQQSAAWAAVTRIAGGFGTVSVQLISPTYDAAIGRHMRSGNRQPTRKIVQKGLAIGMILGAVASLVSVVAAYASFKRSGTVGPGVILILICAILYWGTTLATSPIAKSLTLLGGQRARLLWDSIRFAVLVIVAVSIGSSNRLIILSSVTAAFNVVYILLVFRHTKASGLATEPAIRA